MGLVGEPPPLPPLTMASKAESVASITSQCSFSSTIVHVGDKKPPDSGSHHRQTHRPPYILHLFLSCLALPFTSCNDVLFFITDIVMEEAPTTPTLAHPAATPTPPDTTPTPSTSAAPTPPTNTAITPPPLPPPPPPATQPERDSRRNGAGGGRLGLTKEVLSAHTQQEEQAFLHRFKDLSKLRVFDRTESSTVHCQTPSANPLSRGRCTAK